MLLQALDIAPAALLVVDAGQSAHPIRYANAVSQKLLGRTSESLLGSPIAEILVAGRLPIDISRDHPVQIDHQVWKGPHGPTGQLEVQISPLMDQRGDLAFWVLHVVTDARPGQSHSAAELRDALVDVRRRLSDLERTDSVTGLANRHVFEEILQRDWSIARRDQRGIGVVVLQIDCLTEYQAIYGRHATDSLLQKVGHAITGSLRRDGDFAGRIADDRFAVLVTDGDEQQSDAIAIRIAAKVRNLAIHHPRSSVAKHATVSFVAAAEVPPRAKRAATLLEECESRMVAGPAAEVSPQSLARAIEPEKVG